MLHCIMVNTCFTITILSQDYFSLVDNVTVCIFFFALVFVFIMPISTVPNCKIIVLAVPTMLARLKKAQLYYLQLVKKLENLA